MTALATSETATCTFAHDTRGFIHAVMRPGCEMHLADAQENVAAIFAFVGRAMPVLVDMRGIRSQSREARLYFEGPQAELATRAVALLIGSPVSRVLANFFMRVRPQRIPTRLFTSEVDALAWLGEWST